ncbi:rhodanese-related sulfurtransferase [Roseibium sp. TrichSKD4]|uniref:YgaP-like transmembrane domain n=1 Tax=Roseibium sp. TrichSKD4 TaxID=744980 RepID=UPI0001E5771E|nr:rhodanese-related sulfurtransferase [Roseibium sp. TrichSKD4]
MVLLLVGVIVLASAALAALVNINFLWLTGLMGLNLIQAAFTGTCPGVFILSKIGLIGRSQATE